MSGRAGRARAGACCILMLTVLATVCACRPRDEATQAMRELRHSATRERAIAHLVRLVVRAPAAERAELRARVVSALMEAYREDDQRDVLIEALARLGDPRAEPVFASALADVGREGPYREAAVRSARALGELRSSHAVPALIRALRQSQRRPFPQREAWLQRTIVQALAALGDRRAVPVLITLLDRGPLAQSLEVARSAVHALGGLGVPQSIAPLTRALAGGPFGLLLGQDARRALCAIGPEAVPLLRRAAEACHAARPGSDVRATAAWRVLGDVAPTEALARLVAAPATTAADASCRLSAAEAAMPRGVGSGEAVAVAVLQDEQASIESRRRAAALLGWYGDPGRGPLLLHVLAQPATPAPLRWELVRAYGRLGSPYRLARLRDLVTPHADPALADVLQGAQERLAVIARCPRDAACLFGVLDGTAPAAQERAWLELGRRAPTAAVARIAKGLSRAEGTVAEAMLVLLDRATLEGEARQQVIAALRATLAKRARQRHSGGDLGQALRSRMFCLLQRLDDQRAEASP